MKIALVVDDFRGGAGNIAQILALELTKDHDVSVIATNLHSQPRYDLSPINVYDTKVTMSGKNKIAALFRGIKTMRKTISKDVKADLIISFLDNNNSLVCLSQFMSKIPIIVSERSNPVVIFPKSPWDKIRRVAYRRADVVSVQFAAFSEFDGGRYSKKIFVTPNIVEAPARTKERWQAETVKFVTFGRLADIKRMDLMIELFAKAQQKMDNTELHIFGDGPNREKLENLIASKNLQGKVFLHGHCNHVHEMLLEHDVYLMTSYQEGFPNSLSEAMAVGLPSISFMCHEGIDEMVEHGAAGFAVAEGDREGYVNKMLELASDPALREKIGAEAKKIADRYKKERVMEEWRACIETAISRRKG